MSLRRGVSVVGETGEGESESDHGRRHANCKAKSADGADPMVSHWLVRSDMAEMFRVALVDWALKDRVVAERVSHVMHGVLQWLDGSGELFWSPSPSSALVVGRLQLAASAPSRIDRCVVGLGGSPTVTWVVA